MLVLMDRGFDAGKFLAGVAATRAQFLVRLTSARRPPLLRDLPDGSFLSLTGGVKVRIITATVTVTCHDGTTYGDSYRLAATLLDHRAWPAHALIALYHERWEHEITYLALRRTLLNGRVLRSGDPAGLEQEMRALLARCQALRIAITDAVATIAGTDPDRASYQVAVQTARMLVTGARNVVTGVTDLAGDIGRAVLASLHPPRRPRVCARRVRSPLSRWNKNPPGKPVTNLRVTKITTAIRRGHQPPATRRQRSLTQTAGPHLPGIAASWAAMVSVPGESEADQRHVLPAHDALPVEHEHRSAQAALPRVIPYCLLTARPVSASSGILRSRLRANRSWLSTSCGLRPQTTAPRLSKLSKPEMQEHSCRVQAAVSSPG